MASKASVLMICCLIIGPVKAKSTSDIYRELEEVLGVMDEETPGTFDASSESLTGDAVDVMTRMTDPNYDSAKAAIDSAKVKLTEEFLLRNLHFSTGIDRPPDGSSAASMAGLNDMAHGSEGEHEENKTLINLFATSILLESGLFASLDQLVKDKNVKKAFSDEDGDCDRRNRPNVHLDCSSETDAKYRRINGTCNNLRNPLWGSTGTPQVRLLDAEYEDGIGAVRITGSNGQSLPSPRTLSAKVLRNESDIQTPDDPIRSVMVTVWGQFLDHDLTETPMTKGRKGTNVGCCTLPKPVRDLRDTQCAAIEIEPNDHHFTKDCMDLVRSLPTTENPCVPGIREQINAITVFIDGSQVYGSEEHVAELLRTRTGGLMKVQGDNLLPENDDHACLLTKPNTHCLLAGDIRVNENPHLGAIHISFVRFHNVLAERFKTHGLTDDEEIYQRTRKIIGAIMQHVTYSVWLPDVIGKANMRRYRLTLDDEDPYNDRFNPSAMNEFSTAAMRYGHTLVSQNLLQLDDAFRITPDSDQLDNHFFRTDMVYNRTQLQNLARWMVSLSCKKSDPFFVPALHDNLFLPNLPDGLDLGALNIQRGREHGLPSYIKYRQLCRLSVPKTFADLQDHTPWFQQKLEEEYKGQLDDIDLFVGAMSEIPVLDGHIGKTFACLLGLQFRALKQGDRFWFERPLPQGLSEDQRNNIKAFPLAKLFCEVFRLPMIQKNIFEVPRLNEFVPCSSLNDIDVTLWTR